MCGYHFQQNSSKSTIYIKKVVSNCTKLNFQFNFYPKPEFFVKKHHKCAKLRSRPVCWRGTASQFEKYTQRLVMVECCLLSVLSYKKSRVYSLNRTIQSLPYDPHSVNLQNFKFLQKFSINYNHKWLPNVVKYRLNHNQKENFKKMVSTLRY